MTESSVPILLFLLLLMTSLAASLSQLVATAPVAVRVPARADPVAEPRAESRARPDTAAELYRGLEEMAELAARGRWQRPAPSLQGVE